MAPAKKTAARQRPAAKKSTSRTRARAKQPEPEIQVNRTPVQEVSEEDRLAKETQPENGEQRDPKEVSDDGDPLQTSLDEARHFLDPHGHVAERNEATRNHAERTGGGPVVEEELTLQRLQHSARTDGFKY